MYPLLRTLLFSGDPEKAHGRALRWAGAVQSLGLKGLIASTPEAMPTQAFGLELANPVGLAAGLDKDGAHIDTLAAWGFGFIEVGTVTPRPQPGNPAPRLFRLTEKQAIINRMGFNNGGVQALVKNLERKRWNGPVGVNIGKNKDTPNEQALDDYRYCLERVWDVAGYIVVNISSPNTAGLRELQHGDPLRRLIGGLREAQERLGAQHGQRRSLLLKIAPDLSETELTALASTLNQIGIDGVIATNTTLDRSEVQGAPQAGESGGLSGKPLYTRSTEVLRRLRGTLDKHIPIIGVGGILSGADAVGKMSAGASLVQIYSGLIYRGPELVAECVAALHRRRERGMS